MNRRIFLQLGLAGAASVGAGGLYMISQPSSQQENRPVDNLARNQNFENNYSNDVFLAQAHSSSFVSVLHKLEQCEKLVGHGNFNLLGFDDFLRYARYSPDIGALDKKEQDFIESIFHFNASDYGFYGEKVMQKLTDDIQRKDVSKIAGSGHYLFNGQALKLYGQLRKEVGDSLVLTSGVRSMMKQLHLFLAKTEQCQGNLSRASRSLAPPGHSFHAIGDFDVGRFDLADKNFTEEFARTREYQRLCELGYVTIRYPRDNKLGVRYEPWHIKVV